MKAEKSAPLPAGPSPKDTSYRRNQLPAGVTMVQVKRRFAALRIRSNAALRTAPDGAWEPLTIETVSRAKRPWVVRVGLVDGRVLYLRPFLPGEAGLRDCGYRVGGIGDSAPLDNDPLSTVIAVLSILFYVLASPFFIAADWRRSKVAARLVHELRP